MEPKRRPPGYDPDATSGEEELGYEEEEESAEEEPAAAGRDEAPSLDAALDVLFGSVGEDISQSLYGGWQVLARPLLPDFPRLVLSNHPRDPASWLRRTVWRYAIPSERTPTRWTPPSGHGHGHARTKAAPLPFLINLGVQRCPLIRHKASTDAMYRRKVHTSAKTNATWPDRSGRAEIELSGRVRLDPLCSSVMSSFPLTFRRVPTRTTSAVSPSSSSPVSGNNNRLSC